MGTGGKKNRKGIPISAPAWIGIVIGVYLLLKAGLYYAGRVFFDEGVYVAIAKYFATGGQAGYFEHIRPLLLPALLAPLQYLPFDPLTSGRFLGLLLTVGAALAVFNVARTHFDETSARWAVLLFAMSSSVVFFGGMILTDVAVFTLVLLCASFAWQERPFAAGCTLGIAFLMKFPVLLLGLPVVALFLYRHKMKAIRQLALFAAGVALLCAPYLLFNAFYYDGPLVGRIVDPLLAASGILQNDTWLYEKASVWRYAAFLVCIELPLVLSFALGWTKSASAGAKARQDVRGLFWFFTACAAIFFAYFSLFVARLDYRYMLSAIPFFAVLGGYGLARSVRKTGAVVALIMLVPVVVCAFVTPGIVPTNVRVPPSEGVTVTNAGQALLQVEGQAELYPGPNMGHLYEEWKTNESKDVLVLDLEGFPCQQSDVRCKEELHRRVGRLLTANAPVACGQLYGEDVIVLAKRPTTTMTGEACAARLRSGPYPSTTSHPFVRVQAAVFTQEGKLQHLEQIEAVLQATARENISTVLVLVATQPLAMENETRTFIASLPEQVQLGVLPREGIDTEKFMTAFSNETGRTISVVTSPADDWIGRSQAFPTGITSCVRGAWDQTIMQLPCRQIDLFTVEHWETGAFFDEERLQARYDAFANTDDEVGVDIPADALTSERLPLAIGLLEHIARREG